MVDTKITPEIEAVIRASAIAGNNLTLPHQLERKLYDKANKVLVAAGGKWNKGAKAHVFDRPPLEKLGLILEAGIAIDQKQHWQAFNTPREVANRMALLASIGDNHRVLEPSAGTGNLFRLFGNAADKVAVELNGELIPGLLKLRLSGLRVIEADFLTCNGDLGKFDRVVMNPPFAHGDDIRHIKHALTFLKPGGRLVALCANGPRQQEQLQPLATSWEALPAGSFSEQGTNVNVALLVIDN